MTASRRRVLLLANVRPSFDHSRRGVAPESPPAARWPRRAEEHSRYHDTDSRMPREGCTRLVPWTSAFPGATQLQQPMPALAPLSIEGREWYRLVPADRARHTSPGVSVPTAGR